MKLSSKERTGLRAMVELARHYGGGPVALSRVADAQDLPLPYLERVVASLRRAGVLESVRGTHGGYMLSRPPEEISVGDVFRAVEGTLVSVDCMQDEGSCARLGICATRTVWENVAERLRETLDSTSLADILQETGAADLVARHISPPRQREE